MAASTRILNRIRLDWVDVIASHDLQRAKRRWTESIRRIAISGGSIGRPYPGQFRLHHLGWVLDRGMIAKKQRDSRLEEIHAHSAYRSRRPDRHRLLRRGRRPPPIPAGRPGDGR